MSKKVDFILQRCDVSISLNSLTKAELDAVEIYIKRLIDSRETSEHDQIIHCKRERMCV